MTDLFVKRDLGELRGPDVVNRLLATDLIAIERGTSELDKNSGLQEIELVTVFRTGVEMGQLVEVLDALQGRIYRGKIKGIRHIASGGVVQTQLTLDKPSTFLAN